MKDIKVINIKIEAGQLTEAKKMAHRREMTLSEYIRELIFADLHDGIHCLDVTPETVTDMSVIPGPDVSDAVINYGVGLKP
jgi:hypothetical protein